MMFRTSDMLYVIKLKLNGLATEAKTLINLKNYPSHFALCELPVVKVGITFGSEKRTLREWDIG